MDRDEAERLLRPRLDQEPIVAAWLFGSVVRGTATARSDVDVAILEERERPFWSLLGLQSELTAIARREVQLVSMRTAPPDLVHRVLRDGRLLFEHDKAKRIRFEVDARNRYFDMRPILIQYRRGKGAA